MERRQGEAGEHADNSGRFDPPHSRKFTAALQAGPASDRPMRRLTSPTSHRGIGASLHEAIRNAVDADSFLFDPPGVQAFSRQLALSRIVN